MKDPPCELLAQTYFLPSEICPQVARTCNLASYTTDRMSGLLSRGFSDRMHTASLKSQLCVVLPPDAYAGQISLLRS